MRHRHNGLQAWRRYHASRWLLAVGLVVLLTVSALGGAALTHAFPSRSASAQAIAPLPRPTGVKAEGDWFQLSHFNNKLPPADARQLALQQAAKLPVSRIGATVRNGAVNTTSPVGTWTPLGPQPINGGGVNVSGRITALAVNPSNSNDVWAGAADGGLWHSTDGGQTWAPITDNQPTLSIGAITIDPRVGNPYTIYVGTGEGNLSLDAYWGYGVLKSSDGGATWTLYPGGNLSGNVGIPKIAIDPFNHNNVLAAADIAGTGAVATYPGVYYSTDGGQNWGDYGNGPPGGQYTTDLVYDPLHQGMVYAGTGDLTVMGAGPGGIYRAYGYGGGWSLVGSGAPSGWNIQRVSLAMSNDGTHIYALIVDSNGDLINGAIYGSTDNGTTWSAVDISGVPGMANDDGEHQWWYDAYIAIDPTDTTDNTIYVGGVDIWRTTLGMGAACHTGNPCTAWTNITNSYGPNGTVHPDQHALAFIPGTSSFYIGGDGGVWKGDASGNFTDLNSGGLNITQFYGGSIGEIGSYAQLYGGAQDNGESQYPMGNIGAAQTWNEVFGGDGGDTAVDYTNNANVYEEYTYLSLNRSTDGGANWYAATTGINQTDPVNFIAPFVMSQSNPHLLVAGTDRVYRTTNGAASWTAISPPLHPYQCGSSTCYVPLAALAIAPSNNNVIYASDDSGEIFETTNGGASWSGGYFGYTGTGYATGLAVDPTNPNVAYASFNGFAYTPGIYHLEKTTNAGGSWTDASQSLPNAPFESVVVNPSNHNLIAVGTDAGVFVSGDAGNTWARLGAGLPNAAIDSIFFDHQGGALFVATHGRGMWVLQIPLIATTPVSLTESAQVGTDAAPQQATITNFGFGASLDWSVGSLPSWVNAVTPSSGSIAPGGSEQVTITYNTSGYTTPQILTGNIVLTDPSAGNSSYPLQTQVHMANLSKTWYFAEGHTGDTFTEFLTLENPNASNTSVTVQYLLGGGQSPITKTYNVGPNARSTIRVNSEVGAPQDVSMVVTASQPIVAERPLYFTYHGLPGYAIPGGSDVLGATALNSTFDFGYLDTSTGHDTWLTILNQNSSPIDVHVSYYAAAGGKPTVRVHTVAANGRGTIHVNREGLPAGSYSALVSLTGHGNATPALGLVERPLYLKDGWTGYTGSADVIGVSQPLSTWYFAEGYVNTNFSERYILFNPSATATVNVTIQFLLPNGGTANFLGGATLAPGAQQVINANSLMWDNTNDSAVVTSTGGPILAERFMSFDYNGGVGGGPGIPGGIQGASDVFGAAAPAHLFEFAEGYTGPTFAEYLTIENPNSTAANVTVRYLPQSGGAPTVVTYIISGNSRYTVYTNRVMYNQSFSMEVLSDQPIVAERPMYFSFSGGYGPQNGGSDVMGYAP